MRENSSCFFANRSCKYYPCHEGLEELNCLFCYCPLYFLDSCPGTPSEIVRDGKKIKDCSRCTYPHEAEHYGQICRRLRDAIESTAPSL